MKNTNKLIAGSALGLAAVLVAIDHTYHHVPDPIPAVQEQQSYSDDESPCGMGSEDESPCGLGD